ncbi:MAG: anti-sigma factor antagonist [Pseudonocardiales bacterium]|jgi:anti-sigma B factor antagonist|nr:anti-sigma factor antagonist [Pseudonocardiales bacterium]
MTATAAVRVEHEGTTCFVRLTGEVDLAVAREIDQLGAAMIETTAASEVIIDMADVTFLDSTGIGALIALRNAAGARGLPLRVEHAGDRVRRILAVTGLDGVFGVGGDDGRY